LISTLKRIWRSLFGGSTNSEKDSSLRLWLDDIRPAPEGWLHVKTAREAIAELRKGQVTTISLDHDLGDDVVFGTGYDVAKFIEEAAYHNTLPRLQWKVHSGNSVGARNMRLALVKADIFWERNGR
jgi:hypothetical protein